MITPFRLFTFLSGVVLAKIGYTSDVYFKIGALAGRILASTRNFDHEAFHTWSLPGTMQNWSFLEAESRRHGSMGKISAENAKLALRVSEDFKREIIARRNEFEFGKFALSCGEIYICKFLRVLRLDTWRFARGEYSFGAQRENRRS